MQIRAIEAELQNLLDDRKAAALIFKHVLKMGDRITMTKAVCVFAGSLDSGTAKYHDDVVNIIKALAINGCSLVYGGTHLGLMNVAAVTAQDNGMDVIGVVPQHFADIEFFEHAVGKILTVDTFEDRIQKMADISDAFLVLPGGYGTLEEFFQVITMVQLGYLNKPCGVFNCKEFYFHLNKLLRSISDSGFVHKEHVDMVIFESDATTLVKKLLAPYSSVKAKW
jgi:uncharacterized protein (TIGR00730 family)